MGQAVPGSIIIVFPLREEGGVLYSHFYLVGRENEPPQS